MDKPTEPETYQVRMVEKDGIKVAYEGPDGAMADVLCRKLRDRKQDASVYRNGELVTKGAFK